MDDEEPIVGITKGVRANTLQPIAGNGFQETFDPQTMKPIKSAQYVKEGGISGTGIVKGGLSLLSSLPSYIQMFDQDGEDFDSKSQINSTKKSNLINSVVSGASMGLQVGGPWGALIGGVVGAGAAGLANKDLVPEYLKKLNEDTLDIWEETEKERLQNFYDINSADRIKQEYSLMRKADGYIT